MAVEWISTCKDCNKEFGYSDASYRQGAKRGQSRPERCSNCRRLHSREISTIGLSHFELTPIHPIPSEGLTSGKLGKLDRAARTHTPRPFHAEYDFDKFGIKDDHIRAFYDVLLRHQIVVVVAPTGAGKSTLLPYRLIVPPKPYPEDLWSRHGQIIITQPRIQATRNIPDFVASKLHGSSLGAGYDIGFKHSGDPATDRRNKLVYMTDGSLINMIVRNEIGTLSIIMIDEAHERSLNIDLILGLLKEQLPKYPHLKLIIASATIDTQKFLTYYGGPKINPDDNLYRYTDDEGNLSYKNNEIDKALGDSQVGFYGFPGKRQHPVETRYRSANQEIREDRYINSMPEELANKVFEILLAMTDNEPSELTSIVIDKERRDVKGDILAFLHGERPIQEAVEKISEKVAQEPRLSGKVDVLPLYTKLTQDEQDLALKPKEDPQRIRVVISTNVAETSLTVEGIVHVIDSGLIYEKQWEPETQTIFVKAKRHSQAGCRQRWGRAGRVQPGIAHCLYTEDQFNSFPEHTLAEIARSPIDQIILTAKTAGIGDITKFNWIQPPSPQELGRSPAYLQQIGALDADGDLTNHGLELRTYPAEIEYANLMILADRFGCAVEMATLLPMLELGGYTSLLHWDRNWDAPTKRAVHAIQRGLIEPCEDDVEFYLKLWDAWEGTRFNRTSIKSRKEWANHFFVNHEIFDQVVNKKRSVFLDSLAAHKKSNEVRPVSFELLDRVRIVMTYGLCNHIYHRSLQSNGDGSSTRYQAYIENPDRHPELVALHKGATVQISPESVLHQRPLPDYFVCGKRHRQRLYVSALSEPETIISAAFIAKIDPDWLKVVEQPIQKIIQLIHNERTRQKITNATELLNRLFIDQLYPVGAVYKCQRIGEAQLRLEKLQSTPIKLVTGITHEGLDDAAQPATPESEGELAPMAGVSRDKEKIATAPDEENDNADPIWAYLLDEAEERHANQPTPVENRIIPEAIIISDVDRIGTKDLIEATISGYICISGSMPVLKLRPVFHPDPFTSFQKTHSPGKSYDFEIVGVEHYINDPLSYLIVRDPESRLEIGLDPYDAGLTGRNYTVDYLNDYQGELINITVEKIKERGKVVRLSRLAQAEVQMIRFLGSATQKTVDARIMEVRDNGMHIWLDSDKTVDMLPCGGFVHIQRLPNRPDEMVLGKICRVQIKPKKRAQFQKVKSLPEKVEKAILKERVGAHLIWDPDQHRLGVDGRISYIQRNNLLALSEDPEYLKAIHILFRRSNEFELDIVDLTGITQVQKELSLKGDVTVTIVSVSANGALVRTDQDFEIFLKYPKIIPIKGLDLTNFLIPGQVRKLNSVRISADGNEIEANLLRPEDNPQLDYPVGKVVTGTVSGFLGNGSAVFITLQPGMTDAFLPQNEVAFEYVKDLQELFKPGEPITVRVIENDIEKQKLRVSRKRLYSEQRLLTKSNLNKLSQYGDANFRQIERETQTLILKNNENVFTIEGSTIENVIASIKQIEMLIGTALESVPIPIKTNQTENEFLVILSEYRSESLGVRTDVDLSSGPNEFAAFLKKYTPIDSTAGVNITFRNEIQLTQQLFEELTFKESNEFEKLFGIEQSLLNQITSQVGVKYELDPTHNLITLVGNDQLALDIARRRIELAITKTK